MNEQGSGEKAQKKVVVRNVAIALGIICIVLAASLVGVITNYTSIISGKDNIIAAQNSEIADMNSTITSLNSQIQTLTSQVNQLLKWLNGNKTVTSSVWATSTYRVEVPPSLARFENGIFTATARQSLKGFFGASLIQQGDNPHGQWNASNQGAGLKKYITIDRNDEQQLILNFSGKRTSSIEWFTDSSTSRGSNIGVLLVGGIEKDYYSRDTSQPHALFIDIYLDTNPQVTTDHWQGIPPAENDYHSAFPAHTMPELGKEYEFSFRIDPYIRDALNYWGLDSFTLRMVQCYIEAEASNASIEVNTICIST